MRTQTPRPMPSIAAFLLAGVASHALLGFAAQVPLTSSGRRPLADVVRQIENRFDWMVTYEDPSYANASEMIDVGVQVRKTNKGEPVMVPRGGTFVFNLPARDGQPLPGSALPALIDQYHRTRLPGRFEVRRAGARWHVVPTEALSSEGAFNSYQSILDARVEFPAEPRSALDMLEALVRAVQVRDPRLQIGTVYAPTFSRARIVDGASGEPARDVLSRILDAVAPRLSWQLLCSPGQGATCALNVHQVRPE